jgi:hypothetical protein
MLSTNTIFTRKTDLSVLPFTHDLKHSIISFINNEHVSVEDFCRKHKLLANTVRKWMNKSKFGKYLHEDNGRPRLLDDDATDKLLSSVSGPMATPTSTFKTKYLECIQDTNERRGKSRSLAKLPDNKTIKSFINENNLAKQNIEEITDARYAATFDVYNAISYAAMNYFVVPLSNPHLIINYDATQYKVGYNQDGAVECVVMKSDLSNKKKVFKTLGDKGLVSYFIKWFCVINASGQNSSPVFLIADSSMEPEDIDVHFVKDLGCSTQVGSNGYVVFCKTRCGNRKFYEWFNKEILIPFITTIRDIYELQDIPAYLTFDGEKIQISVYSDQDFQDMFRNANTYLGKLAASCTAIQQPCDHGKIFLASKASIKSILDENVIYDSECTINSWT